MQHHSHYQQQQAVDPTVSDLEAEIVAINKERKRWERKRVRLQQQLSRAQPAAQATTAQTPPPASTAADAATTNSNSTPPSDGGADVTAQPSPKRRVVLRGGVQEAITKLQSKPSLDEEKIAPSTSETTTTAAIPQLPATTAVSSTSSVERVRGRRMFAGLLSHLSAASTTLTRDRTTLAQQQRMQQPDQPTTNHNTTQQLTDALSRCQQVESSLHKKHVEYRRRCMHSLHQQTERWKDEWLWTDDSSSERPTVAWRVREMTQVWQVVREEEDKRRRERKRKERMKRGEEDEDVVEARRRREGWREEDESELRRLIQLDADSRQEPFPTLAADRDGDDSIMDERSQKQSQQASFYKPPGRRQQPPSSHSRDGRASVQWQHSDVRRHHSGEWQREASEQQKDDRDSRPMGGSKRRRDSIEDDRERDGRRSRAAHRRPAVDEFGRDVHDNDSPIAVEEETIEERTAREKAEKLKEEETEKLLTVD